MEDKLQSTSVWNSATLNQQMSLRVCGTAMYLKSSLHAPFRGLETDQSMEAAHFVALDWLAATPQYVFAASQSEVTNGREAVGQDRARVHELGGGRLPEWVDALSTARHYKAGFDQIPECIDPLWLLQFIC